MRILAITFLFLFNLPCYSQAMKETFRRKELDLPASFTDSAQRWKPKIGISTPAKVAFGPFSIYDIDKSKPRYIGSKKDKGLFSNTITAESQRMASMTLKYHQDTIAVNFLFTIFSTSEESNFLGRLLFGEEDNASIPTISGRSNEIMITVPADSLDWRFMPAGRMRDDTDMKNSHYFGKLVSPIDTISIFYTTGFKGHTRTWVGHRTGMVFKKENSMLAAVQFYNNKYVWIKEKINPIEEQVAGAFIATLLSIEHK